MLELRQAAFEGHRDTAFRVMDGAAVVCDLQLMEIDEHARTPKQETFSLMFLGPLDVFLPQGMRRLQHGELGEFDVFLVPVGRDDTGFRYEAVFNLMLQQS